MTRPSYGIGFYAPAGFTTDPAAIARAVSLLEAEGHRVVVDTELSYVIRRPCLVVQRTANRKQKRRINASVVDRKFFESVGPFVAENHVIVLTPPPDASMADLRRMADTLNSPQMTALYDRVSGTASVSIKTLMSMKLPAVLERSQKAA